MYKILLTFAIFTASVASYAQSSMDETTSENKVQGSFPELKAPESSDLKWSMGLASGVSSPTGPETSSSEYGVFVGFQPMANMGTGIEANTTRLNSNNDVRQTNVLVRSTYNVGGDVPVLRSSFIGVGVGPVFVSNRVRWAGAPIIGFDIPLNNKTHEYLSLGLEAKYLFVTNTDMPDLFSSALSVKYWF